MDYESVKKCLRSVVQSESTGIPLRYLENSYQELVGEPLKYDGFKSLRDFLEHLNDTVKMKFVGGELIVTCIANADTIHIDKMVKGQRREQKKKPIRAQLPRQLQMQSSRYRRVPSDAHRLSGLRNVNGKGYVKCSESSGAVPKRHSNTFQSPNVRDSAVNRSFSESSDDSRKNNTNDSYGNGYAQTRPSITSSNSMRPLKQSPISVTVDPNKYGDKRNTSYNDNRQIHKTMTDKKSFKQLLKELAHENHLSDPIFSNYENNYEKSKKITYLARVKIGTEYSNLSRATCYTPEDAEENAAKEAFEDLKDKKHLLKLGSPVKNCDASLKEKIVSNIVNIIGNSNVPYFHTGIITEYAKQYNEFLPSNFIEIIKNCNNRLTVEVKEFYNTTKILIMVPKQSKQTADSESLLTPPTTPLPLSSPQTASPPISPPILHPSVIAHYESHDNECFTGGEQILPQPLDIPEGETWNVIVTHYVNTNYLYGRFHKYNDAYCDMTEYMHFYYSKYPKPVTNVIEDKVYVLRCDDSTFRIRTLSVFNNNKVRCVFVDEGDEMTVDVKDLHDIEPKFMKMPFQSFKFSLNGLEMYSNNAIASQKLDSLFTARDDMAFVAVPVSRNDPISVELFDTIIDGIDRHLNKEIMEVMRDHAYDYIFLTKDAECTAAVTNVMDNGDIYVQIDDELYAKFTKTQLKVNEMFENLSSEMPKIDDFDKTEIYYAKYENDWNRIRVLNVISEDKIRVYFVDYGNETHVNPQQLKRVEFQNDPFHSFPFMAVKCRLNLNILWSEKIKDLFYDQFTDDDVLKLKVKIPSNFNEPPLIELTKQSSKESLNDLLCLAMQKLDISDNKPETNGGIDAYGKSPSNLLCGHPLTASGDEMNTKPIPKPQLPKINPNPKEDDDYFDVYVTLAANPYNFYVTRYNTYSKKSDFNTLSIEMQEFYESEENRIELSPNVIIEGIFMAAKADEWRRVKVLNIINHSPMHVMCFLVDYGHIIDCDLKDLQPLYTQFRNVPMQAINASLKMVRPIYGDWDAMACVKFTKMVEKKPFVAIVYDIVNGPNDEPLLHLSLIDTSHDEDIDIDKNLIEIGYAKRI